MDYYIREEAKTEGRDPRQELVDFVVSNKPYSDAYTFRITDNYRVSFARYRLSYTVQEPLKMPQYTHNIFDGWHNL